MFNEQLAVLLLVMANQLSDHPGIPTNNFARLPAGGVEQTALHLKVDPKLAAQASTYKTQHVGQRRKIESGTVVASY